MKGEDIGAQLVEGVWSEMPLIVVQSLCLPLASVELFKQGTHTLTIVTQEKRPKAINDMPYQLSILPTLRVIGLTHCFLEDGPLLRWKV